MNIVRTFSFISGLASINRFSMVRLSRPENLLEHMGMVTLICYLLRNQIADRLDIFLNIGELLARAVVHDVDEFVTGDIARPTKYSSVVLRQLLEKIGDDGVDKLSLLLGDTYIAAHHDHAKEGDIGLVVKVADIMAVVYKLWDEVIMQGNMLMVRQAVHVQSALEQLTDHLLGLGLDTPPALVKFLITVIENMREIVDHAAGYDTPIHGMLKEELFTNGN